MRLMWSIAIPATPRMVDPMPLRIPLVIVGTCVLKVVMTLRATLVALLCTLMAMGDRMPVCLRRLPIPWPRPL